MHKSFLVIVFLFSSFSIYANQETTITGDRLLMEVTESHNLFNFFDNVTLISDDFNGTCDRLTVFSRKNTDQAVPQLEAIDEIIAIGNVVIKQNDRRADAGEAKIYPKEGKIVLEKNPKVVDPHGVVVGHRIIFYKGDNKAHVEGAPDGQRPTVTLSSMPALPSKNHEIKP